MNTTLLATCFVLSLAIAGCSSSGSTQAPQAALTPIKVGADLSAVDLCKAIPQATIEAAMGRKLVTAPERFEYYDATGTSGCAYDAGKDSAGNAHFGYVALTPGQVYDQQPLYQNSAVTGLGESAYYNNGADARQLWVRVNDDLALVVAFGDEPNEAGAKTIAQEIVGAIQ